ncbi:Exoglucanase B precursor [Actinomadura rubteroloni]|uniref:Exoglucanase B n=1 Tax=Actinomadura rubteroloni TaxID=1926885 RepID=A0A2P4US47_9ACTN|nr:fibronectin type III domain-containing protein [Actinomadura rubteroloni]POM27862.1 Exoglucanase B precursor [Actinomadura rubteroloni]
MSSNSRARRGRVVAVVAAAATAFSGAVAFGTAPSASADVPHGELTLNYRCVYPMIGAQDLTVKVKVTGIPDTVSFGQTVDPLPIETVDTVSAQTTKGLFAMDAKSLEGTATAEVQGTWPDGHTEVLTGDLPIPKTSVPDEGSFPMSVNGKTPKAITAPNTKGWGRVNVGNLKLHVAPKNAAGELTALGEFDVQCYQKAGQNNQIAAIYVKEGSENPGTAPVVNWDVPVAPEPAADKHTSVDGKLSGLVFSCKFPIIKPQGLKVDASLPYPEDIKTNMLTPEMKVSSDAEVNAYTVNAMQTVIDPPAASLEGYAIATANLWAPEIQNGQTPLAAKLKLPIAKIPVPESGTLPIKGLLGTAPPLVFSKAGEGKMGVQRLDLYVILRDKDGNPHPDLNAGGKPFQVPCTLDGPAAPTGQNNIIHTFKITGGVPNPEDTKAPTVPGVPAVTAITGTTANATWGASKDEDGGSGLKGYNLYLNGTKFGDTVTEPKAALTGLEAGKHYKLEVSAIDNKGNESAKSSVEFDTKAEAQKPGPVTGLEATSTTSKSVSLKWNAAEGAESYVVKYGDKTQEVPTGTTATISGLTPNTPYSFSVYGVNKQGNGDAAKVDAKTQEDTPQKPADLKGLTVAGTTFDSITLKWDQSTGATKYKITWDGGSAETADTTYTIKGLNANTSYKVTVTPNNTAGDGASASVDAKTQAKPDTTKPSVPGDVKAAVNQKDVTLTWSASKDEDGGSGLAGYYVFQDGKQLGGLVTGTKQVVSGLANGTYTFTVKAVDKAGNVSDASSPVQATVNVTDGGGTTGTYALTGSSFVKGVNGTIPLTGSVATTISGGKVSGDLKLNPGAGKFSLFGFLPGTVNVAFAPQGKTTGTLAGAALKTRTKTVVKLTSIKVFGFEIGSSTCQTTAPADIPLESSNFGANGGDLKGTYTLPALKGCGFLNPLISAIAAGPGNTVTLKAAKK